VVRKCQSPLIVCGDFFVKVFPMKQRSLALLTCLPAIMAIATFTAGALATQSESSASTGASWKHVGCGDCLEEIQKEIVHESGHAIRAQTRSAVAR